MSENQLIQRSQKKIEDIQQQAAYMPAIDVFQPEYIPETRIEEKLRKIYYPLQFPSCGQYPQPDLRDIEEKKKNNGVKFSQNNQDRQRQRLINLDGLFDENISVDDASNELIRQKTRMARDKREEFFQSTGQFNIEKQFFQEQLARLANISFEQNLAIKTFHKNAILSERNNQKKNTSFQLVLNFGGVFISKHPLQNEQQKKFEELRPLMKEWSMVSTYPLLPELGKQIQYLKDMRQYIAQNVGAQRGRQELIDYEKKLKVCEDLYEKQRHKTEELAKNILGKWKQIKQIRSSTGMETVPWKVTVKEYDVPDSSSNRGIKSYDIGLSAFELQPLTNRESSQAIAEENRREQIKSEQYFIRVYINDNEVARTQKFHLQWPSFQVPIHEQVSITVYSAPYKISAEIVKSGFINQVIDTVSLNLPGANSKTITASQKKYALANFASNGKQTRNKKQKQQAKAPAGTVLYMMQWKGQGSRMPPSIFAKTGEQDTQSTQASENISDQKSQPEITEKQLKELFDVRDPRYKHKSLRQKVQDEINKGEHILLPFSHVQSTRLLFLRLRNRISQLQRIPIPLLEEQFERREDLKQILERQKRRNKSQDDKKDYTYFHPSENKFFSSQTQSIIKDIRTLLNKIQGLKLFTSSRGLSLSSIKYKIAEQIINEHIFQQMESPIVVFFKNLFTQRRKLGPINFYKAVPKMNLDEIEVSIHARSAKNLPVRSNSEQSIKNFEMEERRMNAVVSYGMGLGGLFNNFGNFNLFGMGNNQPQYPPGNMYPNRDMYNNYGYGLYNQQPSYSMGGHTFFNQNPNNPNRMMNQEASYEGKTMERINTVIELRFKKHIRRTQSFEGPFPEWNQTLSFNYNMKTESSSLEKIFYNNEKLIKLLVFDITEQSKPTSAIAKIQIKKTKYYIGRIEIPFSLITMLPSLSGMWKLDRPLVIFNYDMMKKELLSNEIQQPRTDDPRSDIPTHLNLDMFTDPIVDSFIAYNTDRKFIVGPDENPLLLQKASDWLEDLNTKRFVKLWLNDINQKSIFICRYLSKNVAPPKFQSRQIQRAARFVSLIPRKYNCHLLQNTEEFHLTADELLKLKMGDDHGILLCNYFNYIDSMLNSRFESYLILGKAFPYGKTIFVLRRNKETNDCQIWDPFRGEYYFFPGKEFEVTCFCIKSEKREQINFNSRDICPMFQATCVVSQNNVYVNKQQTTNPSLIDFNLQDTKLWAAFFTDRTRGQYYQTGQVPTIQPEINEAYYTSNFPEEKDIALNIQKDLYEYISIKMNQQRKNHFTPLVYKLNTGVTKSISSTLLLQQCETFKSDFRVRSRTNPVNDYYDALKNLQRQKIEIKNSVESDKSLYGFTLNFTYTTEEEIWEKIQDTQIHLDENQNIQFVLSVKCIPYTCHLFSVWVFIGTVQ